MSFFRRHDPALRSEIDRVRSEIARLSETVARYDAERNGAGGGDDPTADPPPARAELDDVRARLDDVAGQLAALDARITSVSTELANQLGELGGDIDALANRPAAAIDEGSIEELRDTQVRLANEQARYQIAFRADLARLAEHLQRNRP
jgi:hypothetical protein